MTETVLQRSLSLPLITFYGLGTILGAGIYVLIGKVAGSAGIYAPVSFLLASLLAVFTAFSFAELSARLPRSAGEAVYVDEAFRWPPLSALTGLAVISVGVVSAATMANGFVGYFQVFIPVPDWLIIGGLVIGLGLLAAWGISESVIVATLITLIEIFGLLLILWVVGDRFESLPARIPELIPPADSIVWKGIFVGAFLAFYAFIGFEDMVNVAEEVKDPIRNLPRAIIISLLVATLLYLAVSLAAVLALPAAELAGSRAPLALIYEHRTGSSPLLISAISAIAIINGALIQIIMASRILYGMSYQGWLHKSLCRVNPVTHTPLLATVVMTGLVLVFALWLPLVTLAKTTSFITLSIFALVNLALWRIKLRRPRIEGIRSYPLWVPVIGFLVSIGFVIMQSTAML